MNRPTDLVDCIVLPCIDKNNNKDVTIKKVHHINKKNGKTIVKQVEKKSGPDKVVDFRKFLFSLIKFIIVVYTVFLISRLVKRMV